MSTSPHLHRPAVRLPMLGRTYHYRYGYSWRWAIWAELCWRIEHLPWRYDGQVFAPLARWGYRHRKQAERAAEGGKL